VSEGHSGDGWHISPANLLDLDGFGFHSLNSITASGRQRGLVLNFPFVAEEPIGWYNGNRYIVDMIEVRGDITASKIHQESLILD
jgi:hypothetical protein